MQQLNKEIAQRLDRLAQEILRNPKLTKREIEKILRAFAKSLSIPFDKFKKRMEKYAYTNADEAMAASIKLLMAISKEENIRSLTAKELRNIAHKVLNNDFTFTKWKNKAKKTMVNEQYNMSKAIDDLQQFVGKSVRKRIIGSYLNGDSPAQMAAQLGDRNMHKAIRRNAMTLYKTIKYRARSEANVEIFAENDEYYDWIKWQTVEDESVTEICAALQAESERRKLKASELPPYMITPSHFNCRCSLVPQVDTNK